MDLSIIIVNYNTFELTAQCIRSVYEKTKSITFEIILVDNASKECSPEKFKELFPEITLIASPTNTGFAKGNNLGIAVSRGDYILLLNSDTELINDACSLSVNAMNAKPEIGVLSCRVEYPDGRVQPILCRFPSLSTELSELLRLNKFKTQEQLKELYLGERDSYDKAREADWIWGCFFMISRKALKALPNERLSDRFFMYAEDTEWCWEFKKRGFGVWFDPQGRIIHYLGGSTTGVEGAEERNFKKIMPNKFAFISYAKGWPYALCFFITKGLHFLTLRKWNTGFKWLFFALKGGKA